MSYWGPFQPVMNVLSAFILLGAFVAVLLLFLLRFRFSQTLRPHVATPKAAANELTSLDATMPANDKTALERRVRELTRSSRLVTVLSLVAARIGNSTNPHLVLSTLGSELRKIGLHCAVVTVDTAAETATIVYVSYDESVIRGLEKITGLHITNHVVPKRFWPGDRIIKEKTPVWYGNPREILRKMFPMIPDAASKIAFERLGILPEGQICILPLLNHNQIIGAMPIWGPDLNVEDSPILAVFASQVAGTLNSALAFENEMQQANELRRSNGMILALSAVAAQLTSTASFAEVVDTFGAELTKLGLGCLVGTLTDDKEGLAIRYVTVKSEVIRQVERIIGRSLKNLVIPRNLWPTDRTVVEGRPFWDQNKMAGALNMFPIIPKRLHQTALKMAGINPGDPLCYLPLGTRSEVIGILAVWGASLKVADIPALNIFASQLASAIVNTQLYENESRRSKELAILLEVSQATASESDLGQVLLALASQLLTLSGFESCYITEWDRDTNLVSGCIDHSRVFWREGKRDTYALAEYPRTREVLLSGNPLLVQGKFETEEKQWMDELGRTAVIILPLLVNGTSAALVELATTKDECPFAPEVIPQCQAILADAATWFRRPVASNRPAQLFQLEDRLKQVSRAEVCSISEWDAVADVVCTIAVSADIIWQPGQGPTYAPEQDSTWKWVLEQGDFGASIHSGSDAGELLGGGPTASFPVESLVILPLTAADEHIGLVELYDFNHQTQLTPSQFALLRSVADKASYSIQNARLLQQTRQRLLEKTTLLNEKDVLLKEVHHRVKNNLQVIASLLSLQASQTPEPRIADALNESQNRVRTMALIHEKLYQSTDLSQVDFADYLRGLVCSLTQTYSAASGRVAVNIHSHELTLDIQTAIPCGLIVNELISNALKHAFPNDRSGQVSITLTRHEHGEVRLVVRDDGVGFPEDVDIHQTRSLGLQLVNSLAHQIGASVEKVDGDGTSVVLQFAVLENTATTVDPE